jgi:hypothetical protein
MTALLVEGRGFGELLASNFLDRKSEIWMIDKHDNVGSH